jgi:peptidoglycan/LPS O-acetylase OafA/YrhL
MQRLGSVAGGRDNNLNLIRMTAAVLVLVSHAWPLSLGLGTAEPLQAATGFSLGSLMVFVFFSVSGFSDHAKPRQGIATQFRHQ